MATLEHRRASSVSSIVLAAGSGPSSLTSLAAPTRSSKPSNPTKSSNRPGLLEDLCGRPIVLSVLDSVVDAGVANVGVVVARGAEDVVKTLQSRLGDVAVGFAEQSVPRGTGDAVLAGLSMLDDLDYDDDGHVLIVHGDLPLLTSDVLAGLIDSHVASGAEATVLTTPALGPFVSRPSVRRKPSGSIEAIDVDSVGPGYSDDGNEPLAVAGCYVVRRGLLAAAIRRTTPQNVRGDYNLNDAIAVLSSAGHVVESFVVRDLDSVRSISSYGDLAIAESLVRQRITTRWMTRGVRMIDPQRTYIDADVVLGAGVVLHPGTILRGFTVVGDFAELGPDTHLTDCAVGQQARVLRTTGRDAEVGPRAFVGPFASLEPGAQVAPDTVSGPNFVGRYAD